MSATITRKIMGIKKSRKKQAPKKKEEKAEKTDEKKKDPNGAHEYLWAIGN